MAFGKGLRKLDKVTKVQIVKKKRKPNVVLQRPIALKLVTTLRYSEPIILKPGIAGISAYHVFSLNGMYDPDITGVFGHQPRGFDQLMALYEHYVVIGAKVQFDWATDQTVDPITVVLSQRAGNTGYAGVSDVMEYNNTIVMVRGRFNSGGGNRMVMKCNPSKFLGRSKPLADPQLKGDINNNPQESSYLHINMHYTDPNILGIGSVIGHVTIDYITAFIEPKPVGES